ncbi:MAG: cell division protein FtsA [Candidatus Hydrothermales bacterium]
MDSKRIVCVDLGTSKVLAVFGIVENKTIKVEGYSPKIESQGVESGVVQNIEKVSNTIKLAVEEAFKLKGDVPKKKTKLILVINGNYIESEIEKGFVKVYDSDGEIQENDRIRVIKTSIQRVDTLEKSIIYIHPNEYIVDDLKGIKEPVGMIGSKLEVETFILKAKKNVLSTLKKVVERSNFEVENFVYSPIASSYAVLEEEEINQGVLLMDIGMGTIDVAVWSKGALLYANSFSFGGKLIVNDLIKILRIPNKTAKEILESFNRIESEGEDEEIELKGIGERPSKKFKISLIKETIYSRVDELISLAKWHLDKVINWEKLSAGIVLVGGIAKLKGITEIAESIFNLPCIVGKPKNFRGLSEDLAQDPSYSASLGALKLGYILRTVKYDDNKAKQGNIFSRGILKNIKEFFDNF